MHLKSILFIILVTGFFGIGVVSSERHDSLDGRLAGYSWSKDTEKDYIFGVLNGNRTGLSLAEELKLAEVIVKESNAYDIDPLFVLALIETESTFYNWSRSNKGAVGLMQVLPPTGKYLAGELDIEWKGARTLYNPYSNVKMGVHYYSELLDMYRNDTEKALAAYSSGPAYVRRRIKEGSGVPRVYRTKVMNKYNTMKEKIDIDGLRSKEEEEAYKEVGSAR